MEKIGFWSFLIGLVLAIVVAIFSGTTAPAWAILVLGILGLIVGIVNVTGHEEQRFLLASIGFLISFQALSFVFQALALGWAAVSTFFGLLTVFVAPATAVVAIKALYTIAKD